MNKATARALKLILEGPDNRLRPSLSSFLAQQLKRSPVKPIQREREAKDKAKKLSVKGETSMLWVDGAERAAGICECGCGVPFDESFWGRETLDHFDNGTGKTKRQKLATAWKLRWVCHWRRQLLSPNTATWNDKFRAHCERHGITPVFQHIEHQEVSR